MKKRKLKLSDLSVQSFVTSVGNGEGNNVKGGAGTTDILGKTLTCIHCSLTCTAIDRCSINPAICNLSKDVFCNVASVDLRCIQTQEIGC